MTPQEILDEVNAIKKLSGPHAYVSVGIQSSELSAAPVKATSYPEGAGAMERVSVNGPTFETALAALREKIIDRAVGARLHSIQRMAIEIIQETFNAGGCTEAHLRIAGFTQDQIAELGEEAVLLANKMSSQGPFAIRPSETNHPA